MNKMLGQQGCMRTRELHSGMHGCYFRATSRLHGRARSKAAINFRCMQMQGLTAHTHFSRKIVLRNSFFSSFNRYAI
jgi:hypothetical protein